MPLYVATPSQSAVYWAYGEENPQAVFGAAPGANSAYREINVLLLTDCYWRAEIEMRTEDGERAKRYQLLIVVLFKACASARMRQTFFSTAGETRASGFLP